VGTILYQWFKNNQPITGQTGPQLNLSAVTLNSTAYYSVEAANNFGFVSSSPTLFRAMEIINQGGNGNSPPPVWDFGDLPSTNWTCWEETICNTLNAEYGGNEQTIQYTTMSVPTVVYPVTLAQNGARALWANGADYTWLGTDVTPTDDGTPNANAKGDPGDSSFPGYPVANIGNDFTPAGILEEENGIRMIPNPFPGNPGVNQINQPPTATILQTYVVDPRFTAQGVAGRNLFGSPSSLFVPLSDGKGQGQVNECYIPGSIVWFAVEAYNEDPEGGRGPGRGRS
jgi:hypothetical protein